MSEYLLVDCYVGLLFACYLLAVCLQFACCLLAVCLWLACCFPVLLACLLVCWFAVWLLLIPIIRTYIYIIFLWCFFNFAALQANLAWAPTHNFWASLRYPALSSRQVSTTSWQNVVATRWHHAQGPKPWSDWKRCPTIRSLPGSRSKQQWTISNLSTTSDNQPQPSSHPTAS